MADSQPDIKLFEQMSECYSLIRLNGKIPVEKEWQNYCHNKRAFSAIGFRPGENAGIACGPASGILVVDVDNADLFERTCKQRHWVMPMTRCHQTGSGNYHALFRYPVERVYGNLSRKAMGFDIRGVGGQVVSPGSIHPDTGRAYSVMIDQPIAEAPEWLLDLYSTDPESTGGKVDPETVLAGVGQGARDETLFRYACKMRRKGYDRVEAERLILCAAQECDPPFPSKEALKKVDQAWKRYEPNVDTLDTYDTFDTSVENDTRRYLNDTSRDTSVIPPPPDSKLSVADKVRAWLDLTPGVWHYTELARELQLYNNNGLKNLKNTLTRLVKNNTIERVGIKSGTYQRIDTEFCRTKLFQTKSREYDCVLPLGLSEYVRVQPGNLIVVAGDSNAAKTWFMLEFCRLNLHVLKIRYINCEMNPEELDTRLETYAGAMDLNDWNKVEFGKIEGNYHHHIVPDEVTIIDFIDIHSDFYRIGEILKSIHERVGSGVCLVALQKKQGVALGKGGEATKEKARLYVALNLIKLANRSPFVMAYLEKVKISRDPLCNANGLLRSFEVNARDSSYVTFDKTWRRATKEDYKLMRGGGY